MLDKMLTNDDKYINSVCNAVISTKPSNEFINIGFTVGIGILSILGLSIVFLTIFYQDKLKEHPSPLIARICIAEAIMCYFTII